MKYFLVLFSSYLCCLYSQAVLAHGLVHNRVQELSHKIEHAPNDPSLYLRRGRAQQDAALWLEAIKDYQQAYALDNNAHEALYWLGYAYFHSGNLDPALSYAHRYLAAAPVSPLGHALLARIYAKKSMAMKSLKHFDNAISLDTTPPPDLYLERAKMLALHLPSEQKLIAQGLSSGIERHGNLVVFVKMLIELHEQQRNYMTALSWVDQLPKALSSSPNWLIRKAELYHANGQLDQAKTTYQHTLKALSAMPQHKQNLPFYRSLRARATSQL